MCKRTLSLLLAAATVAAMTTAAFAAESVPEQQEQSAAVAEQASAPALYINEQPVDHSGMVMINGVIYVPVREFFSAALPGCTVTWAENQAVVTGTTAAGEALTVTARPGECYLTANDRCLYVAGEIRLINGLTMAPVSVMARIFNGTVSWSDPVCHVSLGSALLTPGSSYYNGEELDLLSRLINAEAGNQPMKGKIAVANVIFNRMADPRFPGTMQGVIYAANQFSVVNNGAIEREPNAASVIAAKLALEGAVVLEDALYFNRSGLSCWSSRNRPYVTTIGNHDFFA